VARWLSLSSLLDRLEADTASGPLSISITAENRNELIHQCSSLTGTAEWVNSINDSDSPTGEASLLSAKLAILAAKPRISPTADLLERAYHTRPTPINMSLWTLRKDRLLMIVDVDTTQEGLRAAIRRSTSTASPVF
jgi:hypothetical protein